MYKYIIRVNEHIIKVNYDTKIQNIGKYVVYELLKDSKSISKTKKYCRPFKRFITSLESSLLFVIFKYMN